jgi:large subunit ribosomal protein L24
VARIQKQALSELGEVRETMKIRKDDMVEVISGDDAGTSKGRTVARVLRILPEQNKIVVEGVNKVYKHLKPNRRNAQGGRLSKEMPIDISNVLLYCPACRRGGRIGVRYTDAGVKERFCRKCGTAFPGKPLGKARPKYAKK